MESSHVLRMALIKIRLMADISRDARCRADEYHLVLEMISELADRVLDEDETAPLATSMVNFDDEC